MDTGVPLAAGGAERLSQRRVFSLSSRSPFRTMQFSCGDRGLQTRAPPPPSPPSPVPPSPAIPVPLSSPPPPAAATANPRIHYCIMYRTLKALIPSHVFFLQTESRAVNRCILGRRQAGVTSDCAIGPSFVRSDAECQTEKLSLTLALPVFLCFSRWFYSTVILTVL